MKQKKKTPKKIPKKIPKKNSKITKSAKTPFLKRTRSFTESMKWTKKVGLLIGTLGENENGSTKVAAFDLDNTLIETRKVAKNSISEEWNWWHSSV